MLRKHGGILFFFFFFLGGGVGGEKQQYLLARSGRTVRGAESFRPAAQSGVRVSNLWFKLMELLFQNDLFFWENERRDSYQPAAEQTSVETLAPAATSTFS